MSITPELLLQAYRSGIFPMAEHRDDPELFWVDPRRRGILPIRGLHISRSMARRLRRDDYRITVDADFDDAPLAAFTQHVHDGRARQLEAFRDLALGQAFAVIQQRDAGQHRILVIAA